jgi:(E)-4-hydroxy-3-methylbut-2-enyl-diphosphate synthase
VCISSDCASLSACAGKTPAAPVFVDGKKFRTLRGPSVASDFKALVIDYIDQRYGAGAKAPAETVSAAE